MLSKLVFGIGAVPNTDLTWLYAVCLVSIHSQPNDSKYELSRRYAFTISIWYWRGTKY